jgi:hypothetical protein
LSRLPWIGLDFLLFYTHWMYKAQLEFDLTLILNFIIHSFIVKL